MPGSANANKGRDALAPAAVNQADISVAAPAERLIGVPPAGRLIAQRGMFAGPSPVVSDDLYVEIQRGTALRQRHRLVLHPHTTASTNTYFGRFPASYWQRWTVATDVEVTLEVTGAGRVSLVASDFEGQPRVVATQDVSGVAVEARLCAKIDKFLDGGALWVEVTTGDTELVVERTRWTVAPPTTVRPTAVVICTCNRADDCVNTLAALAGDPDVLDMVDAIYVADQGTDTVDSRPRFAEIATALGDKLRYIKQPNLGGAGGFTRGLYEVTEVDQADHANVLFMDDDVLCEPDIVIRLTAFANRTVAPTIVGGQMLYLYHPNNIHVSAEYADLENLAPGLVVDGALHDADLTGVDEDGVRNLQELRVDAGYNGWWSCLIPSEVVRAIGYPLPLFFQWDDIEYGYRARSRGFATVTLPGAGLWHADFHWKDWDEWHRYFNLRNSLITAALHSRFDPTHVARVLAAQLVRYLLSMQYGLAATLLKATDDFMLGPAVLDDGGKTAMVEIRKLRAEYPETVKHPATEVPGMAVADVPLIAAGPTPTRKRAVLLKRLLHQALDKSVHPAGAISATDATWWHVSLFDTAVVTDASQEGVRLRRRDRQLALRLARHGARSLRLFVRRGAELRSLYRAALPRLSSRENWERLYGQRD